jgi:hypothetical protein
MDFLFGFAESLVWGMGSIDVFYGESNFVDFEFSPRILGYLYAS